MSVLYLDILCSFIQRTDSVSLVLLGGVTHTAQDFKVIHAEKLENFPVCDALLLHHQGFPPRPHPSYSRSLLLVLQEGFGHILQGQADCGLRQRALPPADRTLAPGLPLVPELLKTGPAEAVTALQHHGLLEDLAADRTGQLIFQHGARARGHSPWSKGRSSLRNRQEGKYSRLGGSSGAQRHDWFLQLGAGLMAVVICCRRDSLSGNCAQQRVQSVIWACFISNHGYRSTRTGGTGLLHF